MATVSHTIYSHYDPEEREKLEHSSGQHEVDTGDEWLTEKPFGLNKRIACPPRFVRASDNSDAEGKDLSEVTKPNISEASTAGRSWYMSLHRTAANSSSSSTPDLSRTNSVTAISTVSEEQSTLHGRKSKSIRHRKDWFIARALETQAASDSSSQASPVNSGSSTPTLAEILSRDPPPLPSQTPFNPPVFLAIGPENRGFSMLQKSGWEEGEALGRATRRRHGFGHRREGPERTAEKEVIDVDAVVDLTLSSDEEDDFHPKDALSRQTHVSPSTPDDIVAETESLDHNPCALITPLPTVLKSDLLGIGLKAKTIGPYNESVKKITHSQAAALAHARASEEARRLKKVVGRGSRGFQTMKKREEENRKNLLAYMNS